MKIDAIDFFRSSSVQPYPHNIACAGTYPTEVTAFNPHTARIDPTRLGIAGHSLGAAGVSVVQGYGANGADPWPGLIDASNPVDVAVAWDSLSAPGSSAPGSSAPICGSAISTGRCNKTHRSVETTAPCASLCEAQGRSICLTPPNPPRTSGRACKAQATSHRG